MIATILHYCTNDYRFLGRVVQECEKFSSQILVPVADRFFNGEEENRFLLERSMDENPRSEFVRFSFDEKLLYSPFVHRSPSDEDWLCCWHSTARYVARFFVRPEVEWLFFLDVDEVVEGGRFRQWWEAFDRESKAVWFSSYTYGRSADQKKDELQLTGLLVHKDALKPHQILHPQERSGMFHAVEAKKRMQEMGLDGLPMIHHYSWVRSEAECAKKARTWAKKEQKDWILWLKEQGDFEKIAPYFDPLGLEIPVGFSTGEMRGNEKWITRRQILEMEHEMV